jgi:hypothetical protein
MGVGKTLTEHHNIETQKRRTRPWENRFRREKKGKGYPKVIPDHT